MRTPLLALAIAALSASGALVGSITPTAPPLAASPALIPGSAGLSEPVIDFMPDGRMFVSPIPGIIVGAVPPTSSPIYENVSGSWLRRSDTITRRGDVQGGGDSDLEFDSLGRGYFADLYAANNAVAVTKDGISWIASPAGHYTPLVDRQWYAHDGAKYLYLITNQNSFATALGEGAVSFRYELDTPLGELGGLMAPLETPLLCPCGPPGFPSVDPTTGHLFVPLYTTNGLHVYRSTDHGVTFTPIPIPGKPARVGVQFAVSATDDAGNVYVVFDKVVGGQQHVFMSVSTNHGASFGTPVQVSSGTGTHIMPWVVAGAPGKVAVLFYNTTVVGNNNDGVLFANALWNITYVQSLNADAPSPTFTRFDLDGYYHKGDLSTSGLTSVTGGGPDRSLGDFFSAAIKPTTGEVFVASARTEAPGRADGVYVVRMPAGASPLR